MATTLIIGRDAETSQLRIVVGQQQKCFGALYSVPKSVSRQHCSLTIVEPLVNGNFLLKNLKPENVTWVNGISVQSKVVTREDCVTLGSEHYTLQWEEVADLLPAVVDIRPLREVWQHYDNERTKLQVSSAKFGVMRGAVGLLTMGAIVLPMIDVFDGANKLLYGAALVLTLIFNIIAWRKSSDHPQKSKQNDLDFQTHYVCGNCHRFLGNTPYHLMSQADSCPYCRAIYIK